MNWGLFILIWVVLAVFFLISMSLLYYFRHWASRNTGTIHRMETEGVYYKRYIPEQLRPVYDNRQTSFNTEKHLKHRPLWAKIASTITILLIVAISVYSIIHNRDLFLTTIDLTSSELAGLDYTRHHWQRINEDDLPDLSSILATMKMKNFIIPFNIKDNNWLLNGSYPRRYAIKQWRNFADRYNITIIKCNWKDLTRCYKKHSDSIILVLPGYWDFESLDDALEDGANIIAYGPPAQLFNQTIDSVIQWHGLTFEESVKKPDGELLLRGDQLLTLGFDAGLILNVYSPFEGFQALSEFPQAVTAGNIIKTNGNTETRLFAQTAGAGRLVWMDYAPDPDDHAPEINVGYLNALTASIFRFFSRTSYSSIAMWPHGNQFAALMEEDTEYKFNNAKAIVDIFKKHDYPISWYILSNEALKQRQLTRDMAKTGEIACHGDNHGLFTKSSREDQIIRLARCKKVLMALTGVKALSFRPPEEAFNSSTIDAIANNDMTHFIANNDPDRAVPELLISRENGKSLISIPRVVTDDFELWHMRNLNHTETINLIDSEIAWISSVGGLYMFSFHTQYMNDKDHLNTIEYLADKLEHSNAYFATSKDIADWWRLRKALQREEPVDKDMIKYFNPVLLLVDEDGEMIKKRYRAN